MLIKIMAEPTEKVERVSQESMEKVIFVKNRGESVGELIFGFFDDDEQVEGLASWDSSIGFDGGESVNDAEEEEEEDNGSKAEAAKAFWDSQEELLLVK